MKHSLLKAGLAGLRVGFGAFPLSLMKYLWRAKQPYNVSVAAEVAACAALSNSAYLEVSFNLPPSRCSFSVVENRWYRGI
jgi:histidinol-phosphate/aromatic aminotransferase/cobyric acid decarboxylase-like protein